MNKTLGWLHSLGPGLFGFLETNKDYFGGGINNCVILNS